jgi:hypothetical protein
LPLHRSGTWPLVMQCQALPALATPSGSILSCSACFCCRCIGQVHGPGSCSVRHCQHAHTSA